MPLALVALLALAACSHHKPSGAPAPTTPAVSSGSTTPPASSPATTPGSTPSASGGGTHQSGTPRPGGSGGASAGTSSSATTPPATVQPITITLTLAKTCVSPGGTQRADVTTTPNAIVVIDTRYADNKDGQTHGGLKPDGRSDATGHFTFSWTVLPGTPSGNATTYAGTGDGAHAGSADKTFRVATVC
jgi:hypothetical protein